MNKLSKEKRTRILLVAIGTLVISATLWFFLIGEQADQLAKYQDNNLSAQDKLNKARVRIRRKESIENELKDLQAKITEAESRMIPAEQVNGKKWLFDTLMTFIKNRYKVTPTGLSNDPLIGKQFLLLPKFPYSAAAYDVELTAHFHEFGKFLADFENSFPYIHIQHLQISPLGTPSTASGPVPDIPDDLLNDIDREQLRISMRVVVLFKPAGSS